MSVPPNDAGGPASAGRDRPARGAEPPCAAYVCFQSDRDAEWAAALVVGPHGLPVEFVYSGPLRPTAVQAILYQDRLASQVRLALLRSLLRGLRSRPAFFAFSPADMDAEAAAELKRPVLTLGDAQDWLAPSDGAARVLQTSLEGAVGAAEPLGRAVAALAYVVEYERAQKTERE
jgi:hypothetical protein